MRVVLPRPDSPARCQLVTSRPRAIEQLQQMQGALMRGHGEIEGKGHIPTTMMVK